jgi:hypothetical protein
MSRPLAADDSTVDEYECPVCRSCGEVGCGCTKACKPEDPRCMYRDYIAGQLEREREALAELGSLVGIDEAFADTDRPELDHAFVGSEKEDACIYQPSEDGNATAVVCGLPLARHPQHVCSPEERCGFRPATKAKP